MKHIQHLQPSYILHYRPFRNTSLLLDLFTEHHGRIGAVARGARSTSSKGRSAHQPFVPLLISWAGKGELVSVNSIETQSYGIGLTGNALLSGFYLNELLLRLLHRHDPHPSIFHLYGETLKGLAEGGGERLLRLFEKNLLLELGYAVSLSQEATTGQPIQTDKLYYFQSDIGFSEIAPINTIPPHQIFSGEHLLNFHNDQLMDSESLRAAKRLMRLALAPLLGDAVLKTRELFLQLH